MLRGPGDAVGAASPALKLPVLCPQGPNGPQGPTGFPGPKGPPVSNVFSWFGSSAIGVPRDARLLQGPHTAPWREAGSGQHGERGPRLWLLMGSLWPRPPMDPPHWGHLGSTTPFSLRPLQFSRWVLCDCPWAVTGTCPPHRHGDFLPEALRGSVPRPSWLLASAVSRPADTLPGLCPCCTRPLLTLPIPTSPSFDEGASPWIEGPP